MSRRRAAVKRQCLPDARYGHQVIAKFINNVMVAGKKSVAEKIVYDALDKAAGKLNIDQVELFEQAISNVSPEVEVRSRRVGGATYQVPVEVRVSRSLALAIRWMIKAAHAKKSERSMSAKLSALFAESYGGKGDAVKKRDDTHKMAESNRAFAHYKW